MLRDGAKARQRFPKRYRLLQPAAFAAVLRQGRKRRDQCFTVFVSINGLPCARLGVVVSRKVSAKATVRNRVKRHIRESFRRQQDELRGIDTVVIAQAHAATADAATLRASLERHWISIIERCEDSL
ncbi:MAG: ribonuclease P protein component [Acidiferrobacterales bacterium]